MCWAKPFSGPDFLTHSVISKYDPDTSEVYLQTRNKEFYSGAIRLCKCKSQSHLVSMLGSTWFGPFYSLLPLFPSGRWNPQKIQAHLNESNFSISATCLLCCLIDLVPTREAWFFGQSTVLRALSVLPRGWALLGQKKELQWWSSWLKKYFS